MSSKAQRRAMADIIRQNINALAEPGDTGIEPSDAEESGDIPDENPNDSRKLKVLKDPDAHKLVMRIYTQFVSTNDLSDLVAFIQDFDTLLAKFRKGKPMTEDEIEKVEREQNGGVKPSKNAAPEEAEEEGAEGEPDPEADVDEEGDDEAPDSSDSIDEDDDEAEEPTVTVSNFGLALGGIMAAKRKRT